jgi:hypothetical protein
MERQGKRFDVLAEERKRTLLRSQEEAHRWQQQWEREQELAHAAAGLGLPPSTSPSPMSTTPPERDDGA